MEKIAVYNQKGGSGKTTTTFQMSGFLANAGYRVLVIDLDPQANTTSALLAETPHDDEDLPCLLDALGRKNVPIEDCIMRPLIRIRSGRAPKPVGIDVIPSNPDKEVKTIKVEPTIIAEKLEALEDKYDYAIFDFPPERPYVSGNQYNMVFLALCAVDKVIVPCAPEEDSFSGLAKLTEHIGRIKQYIRPQIQILGCYLNNVGDYGTDRDIVEVCSENLGDIYVGIAIRTSGFVKQSRATNRPFAWFQSNSEVAKDFKRLTEYVIGHKL